MLALIGREMRPLIALSIPLIVAMIGQIAITTTDMLMLGRVGPEALAAVALGLSIYHPLMLLGFGIGMAVTPLVAEARAANRSRQMRRVIRQGIWAAVPFTILCAPAHFLAAQLFTGIGQDLELAHEAGGYLLGIYPGLFFALLFNVHRSFLTSFERTKTVVLVTLAAIPLNAFFNYVLIFGAFGLPAFGVAGAGFGSSLTNIFMGLTASIFIIRAKAFRRYAIFNRFWRADWTTFIKIHKIGVPVGLMIVLEVSVFAGAAQLVGLIGTLELAAHQIALQLASITFMVPLGVGQAATARVSLALGRYGLARAAAAGWGALILSSMAMTLTALAFWLMPRPLVTPFLDGTADAQIVMGLAISYLAIAAAFQLVDGLQVAAAHALRGLQDTAVPMWIAAIGYWGVAMPAASYLGLRTELAGVGVWIGLALGLAAAAILLVWRFTVLTRPKSDVAGEGQLAGLSQSSAQQPLP